MTVSIKLNKNDTKLLKELAAKNKLSVSEYVRIAVFERIEDEYDLATYNQAIKAYKANSETVTHRDLKKLLNIN